MSAPRIPPIATRALRAALLLAGAIAASPSSSRAEIPRNAQGDRLIQFPAPHATVRAPSRFALAEPIPAQPWTEPVRIALPGAASAPPLGLDDGGLVVALSAPSATLAWIDRGGQIRALTRLEERSTLELAAGADGRVFVAADNGTLYTVAPDGTVRGGLRFTPVLLRGPLARPDGAIVLVSNPSTTAGEVLVLQADGEPALQRPLPGRVQSAPWLDESGALWLTLTSGPVYLDPRGALREWPVARGASQLVPLGGDSVAAVFGTEIQFRTRRGVALGRLELGAPVSELWPLPGERLAIVHPGAPAEVWIVARDATVAARVPVPSGRVVGVLADASGAFLIAASSGTLSAYGPDGAARWSLASGAPFTRAPVPLPGGGLAVLAGSNALLVYR